MESWPTHTKGSFIHPATICWLWWCCPVPSASRGPSKFTWRNSRIFWCPSCKQLIVTNALPQQARAWKAVCLYQMGTYPVMVDTWLWEMSSWANVVSGKEHTRASPALIQLGAQAMCSLGICHHAPCRVRGRNSVSAGVKVCEWAVADIPCPSLLG